MSAAEGKSPQTPAIDKEFLRKKYAEERDKRIRNDGLSQYVNVGGDMLADPWSARTEREAVSDHVRFTFIGAGWAGLLTGAELSLHGITDVRLVDTAGDVGGTWYWNRYPGARCDTHSLVYLPMLEETGYVPTEHYASAPEILGQCQRIAKRFNLYDNALLQTRVEKVEWLEERSCWLVSTDRGDRFTTDYLGIGMGPLCVPKVPKVPGMEDFKGKTFHTSRWDYDYTGGTPEGEPMEKLRDKRVAVIGTGATAIQCVPPLARDAKELFVIQRTPSSVSVRNNGPIDPDWFEKIAAEPGWQDRVNANFLLRAEGMFGRPGPEVELENILDDGMTKICQRMRAAFHSLPPEVMLDLELLVSATEENDFVMMDEIRARVDAVVEDPETAEKLKPWFGLWCKRPTWSDEYLPTFNRPNTHLVDTDGKGVERITERGVVVNGTEYEVDCIVFASGFDFAQDPRRGIQFDIVGKGGTSLQEAWSDGVQTLHGLQVHGFPNFFAVQWVQGAFFAANVPTDWQATARNISAVVQHAIENGVKEVEPSAEAQKAWTDKIVNEGMIAVANTQCTPGYYNGEGEGMDRSLSGYPTGFGDFFRYIEEWRTSGEFKGLEFR